MAKVYIDTSIVIALANSKDDFHDESWRFMGELQELGIGSTIGPPVLLEIGKAAQRRGVKAASTVLQTIDKFNIELANLDTSRLLNL